MRIIKKAGLKSWPKLFQNLRSTRETELAEDFAAHIVCDWIGNSQLIAAKHYLQITDEHFARATTSDEDSSAQAVQNPVQHDAASFYMESQEKQNMPGNADVLLAHATCCDAVQNGGVPPQGLEP